MRVLKYILLGLLVVVLLVLAAGGILVRQVARKALPDYGQEQFIPGLQAQVEVYRDQHAIPYIYAENEHDLYVAVGFAMAQDRLWQMDLLRRVTQGRLSEIFGADMLQTDLLLRSLRLQDKSVGVLADAPGEVQAALESFALGVNAFIRQQENRLPLEFSLLGYRPEPWEAVHSVNLIGYMAWDLAGSWQSEVMMHKLGMHLEEEKFRQLLPDPGRHPTYVYPDELLMESGQAFGLFEGVSVLSDMGLEVFSASNNWVVSGARSESGYPLLANDMHLGFGSPGVWYQMHQEVKGGLKVSGVVLPGQPFVIAGHNEHIAWGMTNLYVDDMDFYLESLHPDNPDQYLYQGEWKPLSVICECIPVKGADTVEMELHYTHRGPIISSFKQVEDQAISMRWTGMLPSNELRTMYFLNRATNWEEFRDALRSMTSVSQNIVYADVEGNIGMQTAGGVPVRRSGQGYFIKPGDSDTYDWTGLLPFEELPHAYNPPHGMLSSANNRTTGDAYPHYIGYQFAMPFRIDRIREMLEEKDVLGVSDYQRMMGDFQSGLVARYLPGLLEVLAGVEDLGPVEQAALDRLRVWDRVMDAESTAAAVFEVFYQAFLRKVALDEMGDALFHEFLGDFSTSRGLFDHVWHHRESSWINDVRTEHTESFDDLVLAAFRDAVGFLEDTLGRCVDAWEWGQIHQLTLEHPMGSVGWINRLFGLNRGPYPVGGSFHTVNPFGYSFRQPYAARHGASQRHIFDMGDLGGKRVRIPTGTSGIPASPYYLDQLGDFLQNTWYNQPWHAAEVAARARYHTSFSPK